MKKALLLLLIFALSYASQLWQFSTDGAISAKPVAFQGTIVAASDDGKIYSVDPASGTKKWSLEVGGSPNEIFAAGSGVVTSTSSGKLVMIGSKGTATWADDLTTTSYNATFLYGSASNGNEIFVTANNGVYMFGMDGSYSSKLFSYTDAVATPPAAGSNFLVFGVGSELVKVSDKGVVEWAKNLTEGKYWLSQPVIVGDVIFIGALDNKVHAISLNDGIELWSYQTRNWVLSTPLVSNGVVYVGSDDGGIYALDASTGSLNWQAQTQFAVESQPVSGTMGGKSVIFVGSTDKSVYAISVDNGTIVWKGSSTGSAGSALFYQNSVIFGTGDGKLNSYSTERACSIANPHEADVIGFKEVVVRGNYVSSSGGATVQVSINGGNWIPANTSDVDWVYYLDPKAELNPGLNTISCMVADSGGQEQGPTFTSVSVTQDPSISLSNLVVSVSPNIVEGKPFTIFVNDGDDGSPVDRFNLTFNGMSYYSDQNVTINYAPSAGTYTATVSKIGFNDATINVNVNSSGVNPLFVIIGLILIIIVVWQLWSRFLSVRFAKKK